MTMPRNNPSSAPFPSFAPKGVRNYNITTTQTPNNGRLGVFRCEMHLPAETLALYEDDDKWLFDCNVNGDRNVYWEYVHVLRSAFEKESARFEDAQFFPPYQFFIDDTDGKIYSILDDKQIWDLQRVVDGEEYRRYMKPVPKNK